MGFRHMYLFHMVESHIQKIGTDPRHPSNRHTAVPVDPFGQFKFKFDNFFCFVSLCDLRVAIGTALRYLDEFL